jgi:hypothetical protein
MNRRIYRSAERHVWIAWACVFIIAVYAFFSMASAVERGLFPVVSRFDVLSIQQSSGSVKVSGTLIKDRECEIVELRAVSESGYVLKVDYLDRPEGMSAYTRPAGFSSWGPWRIHTNGSRYVTLMAEHRCHWLWTVKTPLAAFQVTPRYAP